MRSYRSHGAYRAQALTFLTIATRRHCCKFLRNLHQPSPAVTRPQPSPNAPRKPLTKMALIRPCTFGNSPLDRHNNDRRTKLLLKNHLSVTPPASFIVLSQTLDILVHSKSSDHTGLLHLPRTSQHMEQLILAHESAPAPHLSSAPLLYLGTDEAENRTVHAIRVPKHFDIVPFLASFGNTTSGTPLVQFRNLRSCTAFLKSSDAAIAAHARSLFEFHARHQYCGACGSNTVTEQGGSRRRCVNNSRSSENTDPLSKPKCKGMWFPRSDPVAIMLTVDSTGEKVLLARQEHHPPGMFSCLAGFMEHGEGVEDAVRREVAEESGITVGAVRFFGSQPWPYPYSLMLGCVAQAVTDRIVLDEHELQEARWFTREQVRQMVRAGAKRQMGAVAPDDDTSAEAVMEYVPPVTAIAGQMCAAFADCDAVTSFRNVPVNNAWRVGML